MSEIIKKRYLDYDGLLKYDQLIKDLIKNRFNDLDAKLGSLEFDGSDDKSFAEVIDEIYAAIAELVAKDLNLDAKDEQLEEKINSIIGGLESLEGSTLADIKDKLSEHADAIAQHTTDIAGVEGRVSTLEGTIEDLKNLGGENGLVAIVDKVNSNITAIEKLNGEGEGSVKKAAADAQAAAEQTAAEKATAAENAAKEYADSLVKDAEGKDLFDAFGSAAAALDAAKEYVDTEMGGRMTNVEGAVAKLEAIDHEKLASDASAAAVAAIVAGAESEFDTLKEVADWINSDTTGAAGIQIKVAEHTESINTINDDIDALEAKVEQDITNLANHVAVYDVHLENYGDKVLEIEGRLDDLEAEPHASIELSEIEGLFTAQA